MYKGTKVNMHCIVHIRVGAYWPEREILIIVEGGRKVNMHFIFSIMQWGWGSQKRHNVNDYWDECRKHVSLCGVRLCQKYN